MGHPLIVVKSSTSCTWCFIYRKWNSSGTLTCTLSWSFSFGVHFFHFLTILFFLPFDFSFRAYPLYIFYIFLFSDNMENLCNKERNEHITELNKSIMKYDTYWYRSITVAPLRDGFSWWKVKSNRSDGLLNNLDYALTISFYWLFYYMYDSTLVKLRAFSSGLNFNKLLSNPNFDIIKDIVCTC